jgi:NADH-quinone oxidoreductase subunit J
METLMFYLFGGLVLISAIFVIFLRKPVHNAVALIFTFFCMAGLYLLLEAEFLAIIQVLVYAGAIMVLFLFVIMLLNLEREAVNGAGRRLRKWLGAFLAIVVFLLLIPVWTVRLVPALKVAGSQEKLQEVGNVVAIARLLFTDYLLPFEVASILLLAAMVGAVFFAMRRV